MPNRINLPIVEVVLQFFMKLASVVPQCKEISRKVQPLNRTTSRADNYLLEEHTIFVNQWEDTSIGQISCIRTNHLDLLYLRPVKGTPHHKAPTESIKITFPQCSSVPKRRRIKNPNNPKKNHQTQLQGNSIHHTAKEEDINNGR